MTQTPDPPTPPQPPPPPPGSPSDINMIKIPLLVSGIINAINAFWLTVSGIILLLAIIGCVFLPFAVAAGILAFFEIRTFLALHNANEPNPTKERLRILAILEICTIIFGNVPSLVCGIIILMQLEKYQGPSAAGG